MSAPRPHATGAPPRHPDDQPDLRASDADRDRVVEALRTHASAGRLEADELEQRVGLALAARTRADLSALTRDLPESRRIARAGGPPPFVPLAVLLVAIWALTGAGYFWPMWPLMFLAFAGIARAAGNTRVIR
jgi:hypothetical protein